MRGQRLPVRLCGPERHLPAHGCSSGAVLLRGRPRYAHAHAHARTHARARTRADPGSAPTGQGSLSVRLAAPLCFLLGSAVTLPPLVAGGGSTSLCLPLPSSSSSSTVALVLLDSLCFLVMTLAYGRLCCRASKAPPPAEEEATLTRHVAWLLVCDCLLFLPIAFLSVSSLLRLAAAGPETAKGVLLLVAPLPACINPLLYVLFNPPARQELAARARRAYGRAAGSKVVDSTQALVAGGDAGEDEEEAGGRSNAH